MLNYPALVTLWFEKNLSDQVETQKQPSVYDVELVQDTNYSIETVDEVESKNLVFVSFSINDNYQPTLIKGMNTSETIDEQEKQQIIQSVIPV